MSHPLCSVGRCCTILIVVSLCLIAFAYADASCVQMEEIILRTTEILDMEHARRMIDAAAVRNIKGLSISFKDDVTGELFYTSSLPGTRPYTYTRSDFNMTMIHDVVRYAQSRFMMVYAWIPCFFDPIYIQYNSSAAAVMMDIHTKTLTPSTSFMSPFSAAAVNHLQALIGEVLSLTNPSVDGIRLDYIRYTDDDSSYDEEARALFISKFGTDPVNVVPNSPDWELWTRLRADKVTEFLLSIRNMTSKEMGGYVLPFSAISQGYNWFTSQGNDYSQYSFFTVLPMVYYEDWSTRSEWRSWTHDRSCYARSLSDNANTVAVFSITTNFPNWGNDAPTTTSEMARILGDAMTIAMQQCNNGGISLFNFIAWNDDEWQMYDQAISYVQCENTGGSTFARMLLIERDAVMFRSITFNDVVANSIGSIYLLNKRIITVS